MVEKPLGDNSQPELQGALKAVLLARYVNLVRHWIYDTQRECAKPDADLQYHATANAQDGLPPFPPLDELPKHACSGGFPMRVSPHYGTMFKLFAAHFKYWKDRFDDDSLSEECKMMEKIVKVAESGNEE